MAQAVGTALESGRVLLVEAGTGTGKTFAYLVPALLSGQRLIISTGTRALQDQLLQRDLPALLENLAVRVSVAALKGRSNYVCHYHLEQHLADGRFAAREDAALLRRIRRFAARSASGDRAECADVPEDAAVWSMATSTHDTCLGTECPRIASCFVMKARQRAHQVDIVVVNHHLFCADLALRGDGVSELLPEVDGVIFDEAHQLPDAAIHFFSRSWSLRQTQDLAVDLLRVGLREAPDAADWLDLKAGLEQGLRQLRLSAGAPGRFTWETGDPRCRAITADLMALHRELAVLEIMVGSQAERGVELPLLLGRIEAMRSTLSRFLGTADGSDQNPEPDSDQVRWLEVSRSGVTLHLSPIDVAVPFRLALGEEPKGLVFTSATLGLAGRIGLFGRQLGFDAVDTLRVESPFDYARQARIYIPRGCGSPTHPEFAGKVARHVWPLLRVNRGRAFVLCTSLRMVSRLHQLLRELQAEDPGGPNLEFLVQGEQPKALILERFRQLQAPVLLGSASFWEGVDVVGQQLSLVVIDKLPFTPPDEPILAARMRKAVAAGEDFFSNWQLPQAAISLKQGAGRLIRSESDKGLLVVCDERLALRAYGRQLLRSLPPFPLLRNAVDAVEFLTEFEADGTLALANMDSGPFA
jgi:ATP-dependent DNA helicase DinG